MKKLSIFLTISLLSFSSFAQKAEDFQFSSDKYDFGALVEGDAASHAFEFTNIGKDTIRLEASDVQHLIGQKHLYYLAKKERSRHYTTRKAVQVLSLRP